MKTKGFTIGKFAPLHKGHQFLIETALKEMDEFHIIIYETEITKVPIEKRANWIKTLYPNVKLHYAYEPPMQYGLDKQSVRLQVEYIKSIIGNETFTHFYSSEPYGACVAEYLGIIDRRVDSNRKIVPVSATMARKNLEECRQKGLIEDIVYQDLKENNG